MPRGTVCRSNPAYSRTARLGFASLTTAFLLWPALASPQPTPTGSRSMSIRRSSSNFPPVATIVVGNPLIADVTLQTGGSSSSPARATAPPISSRWIGPARCWSTARSRCRARATSSSPSIAAWNGNPTAACRSASAGSRSATAENYFKSTIDQAGSLSTQASPTAQRRPKPGELAEIARRKRRRPIAGIPVARVIAFRNMVDAGPTDWSGRASIRRNTSTITFR